MAIPASNIVTINPRLLTAAGTDLEFNGLFLTSEDIIPSTQMVVAFSSADSVGDYFGTTSSEYRAASVYFLGYDNSFAKPRALYFGRLVSEDAAAYIRGADFSTLPAATLTALRAITDGELTITLGSSEVTLTGLDFSACTALSEVAEVLQTALQAASSEEAYTGATVTYDSLLDAFTITAGTTGAESGVTYATGSAAEALLLTEDAGAVLSQGMDAMTIADNMQAITDMTTNFVTLSTIEQPDEDTALALAEWANDQGVDYLYIYWDTDAQLLVSGSDTIAAAIIEAGYGATCGVYGNFLYAALIMGTAASIDWNRRNGTITFAFKGQDGLAAMVTTEDDATVLEEIKMNFVGDYSTRNDEFVFLYPGAMFGDWEWIDTYLNAVWLKNALQVAIMTGFSNTPRAPYNKRGYTLVRSWCMDPINRALYNGVIDTGVTLSQSQIAELYTEAGRDISGELSTDGYVLDIGYDEDDSSDDSTEASVRASRQSPNASLWFTYGGAIHRLDVASTTVA